MFCRAKCLLLAELLLFSLLLLTNTQDVADSYPDIDPNAIPPIPIQEPCNPADSRLDPITHKFRSNCGPRQWCKSTAALDHDPLLGIPTVSPALPRRRDLSQSLATLALPTTHSLLRLSGPLTTTAPPTPTPDFGLCVDKGCRRDEFPFGYRGVPFEALPPQCATDQYCPDDESSCQPLLALGQPCQLNRDDSCKNDESTSHRVLCLQGQCRLANAGLNDICILDSTEYLGYNQSGSPTISTISRDDCQDSLYCQTATSRCQPEKPNGFTCLEDRECVNFNCDKLTSTCQDAPTRLHRLPLWAWILIILTILSALVGLVFGLYKVHLNHRALRAEEIDQFFSQQWQYRHSILSMHAAAAKATSSVASSTIFSRTDTRSTMFPSSTTVATNGHHTAEDGSDPRSRDSAWASGLQVKNASPTAVNGSHSATLSPRLSHRRSPSP